MAVKKKEFMLYSSVNPDGIEYALANIRCWAEFDQVAGVRLIQSAREYSSISKHLVDGDKNIQIIVGSSMNEEAWAIENPKGLPSLRDVIDCMRSVSREQEITLCHGYLNSDIVIRKDGFFEELSHEDNFISMIHRMDVEASESGDRYRGFYMHGVDGFFVSGVMLESVIYGSAKRFYLGLPGWDQYMPLLCWLNRWKVKYVASILAVHRLHATSNPGSYSFFASRLIVVYLREYYFGSIFRLVSRFRPRLPWLRGGNLAISIAHKLVIFTALRALGWKIRRKTYMPKSR